MKRLEKEWQEKLESQSNQILSQTVLIERLKAEKKKLEDDASCGMLSRLFGKD